jgi:hypothetical protein
MTTSRSDKAGEGPTHRQASSVLPEGDMA